MDIQYKFRTILQLLCFFKTLQLIVGGSRAFFNINRVAEQGHYIFSKSQLDYCNSELACLGNTAPIRPSGSLACFYRICFR